MLQFGFEREYFITLEEPAYEHNVVLPTGKMPRDGVLAEARGEPDQCPIKAVYSLLAEEHRMRRLLIDPNWDYDKDGPTGVGTFTMFPTAVEKVSRELRIESARTEQKGLVHYQNLYGHKRHRNKASEMTAGFHVSVTRSRSVTVSAAARCSKCNHLGDPEQSITINTIFDFAQFIRIMDEEFKQEIKETSRRPGFYEIKQDGRMEYRSLPASIDPVTVADFIKEHIKTIHGSW